MTISITGLDTTSSITTVCIECRYTLAMFYFNIMLIFILMLIVVKLSAVMLGVAMLSVAAPYIRHCHLYYELTFW